MADLGEMNVKVGADISGLLSKVDAAKAKLGQLTEENQLLKEEIKDLNQSLKNNDAAIAKVNKTLAQSSTLTKADQEAVRALRKERDQLAASNDKISAALKSSNADLATNTTQLKAQAVAVKEAEKGGSEFAKTASSIFGGLRKIAYILPGIGIAGILAFATGPIIEFIESLNLLGEKSEEQKKKIEDLKNATQGIFNNAAKEASEVASLIVVLNSEIETRKRKLDALNELKKINPEIFGQLKLEGDTVSGLNVAYKAYIENLKNVIAAKILQEKIEQKINDILKLQGVGDSAFAKNFADSFKNSLEKGAKDGVESAKQQLLKLNINDAIKSRKLTFLESDLQGLMDQLSDFSKNIKVPELKPPKTEKVKKDIETIDDILAKLGIQINFLNQKELLLKTSQANAKVQAIEGTINTLMQKFKLLADNPVIVNLELDIKAIQGDAFLKGLLKGDKTLAPPPLDLQILLDKDSVTIPQSSFDAVRDSLIRQLTALGVTSIKLKNGIRVPIDTANITELTQGLSDTQNLLLKIYDTTDKLLSPAFDALFTGILTGSTTAFQAFGKALEQTIVQLGVALLKAAVFASIFAAITGNPFGSQFTKLLGFANGGSVKGFASGGPINGPGTSTSDSIFARLSKGEYVIKADTVNKFGLGFFDKLNAGIMPKFDASGFAKFASGGFVSPNILRSSQLPNLSPISIGGQAIFISESKIRGQDIVTSYKRANATISRNS